MRQFRIANFGFRIWVTTTLIAMFALSVVGTPLAEAQQAARVWRIGLFHVGIDHIPPSLDGLREGLKALGYEEEKNIFLDWRNLADEEAARTTAQEFVRKRVDLIVAFENQTIRAAKVATSEIPIVFLHATDPVAAGLVKSLSHPGGNLTGLGGLGDVPAKRIELFKEAVPHLRRLLILIDPEDPVTPSILGDVRRAAATLKLRLVEREATHQADLDRIFGPLKKGAADGVFVVSPNLQIRFSGLIIRLAFERGLPLLSHRKEWVERGALVSYGTDFRSVGREAARYVDKILKGAKPADLPVEETSRFELAINLKTAKALGLKIPQSLLIRADEVIQ